MKRREVIIKANQLSRPMDIKNVRVSYAKEKNRRRFQSIAETLMFEKVMPETHKKYEGYQKEIQKLYEELSKGKTKQVPGPGGQMAEMYDVDVSSAEFTKKKEALDKKFAETIDEYKTKMEEYEKFLNEDYEEEIPVFMVGFDDLPADISDTVMSAIEFMVREVSIEEFNDPKQ